MPSRSRLDNCESVECFFTLYNAPHGKYFNTQGASYSRQRSKKFTIYPPTPYRRNPHRLYNYGKKQVNLANRLSHFLNPIKAASNLKFLRANVQTQLPEKKTLLRYYYDSYSPSDQQAVRPATNKVLRKNSYSYPKIQNNQSDVQQYGLNKELAPELTSNLYPKIQSNQSDMQSFGLNTESLVKSITPDLYPQTRNNPSASMQSYGLNKELTPELTPDFYPQTQNNPSANIQSYGLSKEFYEPFDFSFFHRCNSLCAKKCCMQDDLSSITNNRRTIQASVLSPNDNEACLNYGQPNFKSCQFDCKKKYCLKTPTDHRAQTRSNTQYFHPIMHLFTDHVRQYPPSLLLHARNNLEYYHQQPLQYPPPRLAEKYSFSRSYSKTCNGSITCIQSNAAILRKIIQPSTNTFLRPSAHSQTSDFQSNDAASNPSLTNRFPNLSSSLRTQNSGPNQPHAQPWLSNGIVNKYANQPFTSLKRSTYTQNSGLRGTNQPLTKSYGQPWLSNGIVNNYANQPFPSFKRSTYTQNSQTNPRDFSFFHKCNSLCAQKCCFQDMSSIRAFYTSGIRNVRSTNKKCPNFGQPYFTSCRFKCQNKFCKRSGSFLYASQNEKRSLLSKHHPINPVSYAQAATNLNTNKKRQFPSSLAQHNSSHDLLNFFFDQYDLADNTRHQTTSPGTIFSPISSSNLLSNISSPQSDPLQLSNKRGISSATTLGTLLNQLVRDTPNEVQRSFQISPSASSLNQSQSVSKKSPPSIVQAFHLSQTKSTVEHVAKSPPSFFQHQPNQAPSVPSLKQPPSSPQPKSNILTPLSTMIAISSPSVAPIQAAATYPHYPEPVIASPPHQPTTLPASTQYVNRPLASPQNLQLSAVSPKYIQSFSQFAQNPQPTSSQYVQPPAISLQYNQLPMQSPQYVQATPQYNVYEPSYFPQPQSPQGLSSMSYATPLYSGGYPDLRCQQQPSVVIPSAPCSFESALHLGFFTPHPELQNEYDPEYELYDPSSDSDKDSPDSDDNSNYEIVDASSLGISPQTLGISPQTLRISPQSLESALNSKNLTSNSEEKVVEIPLDMDFHEKEGEGNDYHHHHRIRIHITNHQDHVKAQNNTGHG